MLAYEKKSPFRIDLKKKQNNNTKLNTCHDDIDSLNVKQKNINYFMFKIPPILSEYWIRLICGEVL